MAWDIAQRATGFGPVGFARQADVVMDRIRNRYQVLWEQAGRPGGHERELWQQAETEIVEEMSLH